MKETLFFPYLVGVTLAAWPYAIPLPMTGHRLFHGLFVASLFLVSLVAFKKRDSWFSLKQFIFYGVFIAVSMVSFFSQPFQGWDTHPNLITLTLSFLFFLSFVLACDSWPLLSQTVRVLLIPSIFLVGILVILHLFVYKILYLTPYFTKNQAIYGFVDKNRIAFFLTLLFPFAYASLIRKRNLIGLAGTTIFSIAIIYSFSRMALFLWIGSLLGMPILAYERTRYFKFLMVLALFACFLVVVTRFDLKDYLRVRSEGKIQAGYQTQDQEWSRLFRSGTRMIYYEQAWRGFLEKPLFGHGFSSFPRNNPVRCPKGDLDCEAKDNPQGIVRLPSVHSDYLQILYEIGLVGIVSLLGVVGISLVSIFKVRCKVPYEYRWIWEGMAMSLLVLFLSFGVINVYETVPCWFLLASGLIMNRAS